MNRLKAKREVDHEELETSMHALIQRVDEKSKAYQTNLDYKVSKAKATNRQLEQKAI